jgi:hypothetical protein
MVNSVSSDPLLSAVVHYPYQMKSQYYFFTLLFILCCTEKKDPAQFQAELKS